MRDIAVAHQPPGLPKADPVKTGLFVHAAARGIEQGIMISSFFRPAAGRHHHCFANALFTVFLNYAHIKNAGYCLLAGSQQYTTLTNYLFIFKSKKTLYALRISLHHQVGESPIVAIVGKLFNSMRAGCTIRTDL